jgi:tetratricopeptide (TPR) repeat protein
LKEETSLSTHPAPAELEAFMDRSLSPDLFRQTARHLLGGCDACNALLKPHYRHLLSALSAESAREDGAVSDPRLDRLATGFRHYRAYRGRETVQQRKLAFLLARGGARRVLERGPEAPPLRGLGALRALLDRSWAVRHENPGEMKSLARLAVEVAGRLSPRWHDERDAADWQARAWSELGNALRVSDDLDEAERAFRVAFDFFQRGNQEAPLKARLHDLYASYLGTRRKFDLAFAALDVVHSTYLELGDSHLAGRALATKAMYLHYSGQPEQAVAVNQQAMSLIDRARDAELLLFSYHNHVRFLVACGQFDAARRELSQHLDDLQRLKGRIYQIRLQWIQAQVSAGLREWQTAEEGLCAVRAEFEREGMGFHAAVASLELALVWMRQGRYEETERMVLEVCDVFIALRVRREALGAIIVLKESFESRIATLGLLQEAIGLLGRWQASSDEPSLGQGK